ncbi:MAG: hydrogenase nickel incorporation protein HypB [Chloroflexi bacterium]|nr:hydrogenase nickel incorporation protein HypB [Chloroflexota bacterium]
MEIKVLRNVLEANDAIAAENRRLLKAKGIYTLNLIASPGAGKTSLLERTLDGLKGEFRMAVIEGDIAGSADAERIGRHQVPVIQINTGGDCHLNANMVRSALESLALEGIQLLFVENVGNLVCPAGFDIGEDAKVVILSVAEGDDKPEKYPLIFERSSAMVLNKIDLLAMVDFDLEKARAAARATHPDLPIFELSARKGQGLEGWLNWVRARVNTHK